ncbi:helix-turn-helix transcriptional regulator [Plantactinospora sp. KBS50]|uniref:helix-turn-helix transcriptional regulator n=1 Tax=Plantactinospora sp. KBS50 TaxID=2024580 RepID=UPI000BAAA577|nr:LuxR family transcriptional regulator [Plantactinospora sp. KBS50]
MLDHPSWDIDELVASLDITETAVHDALAALADRALILPSRSRPGFLHAVSPQIGLISLLDQAEQRMLAQQAEIQATRATILARAASRDTTREREEVVRLEGLDVVQDRLAEHVNTASESFMTLTAKAMPAAAIESGTVLSRTALSRGVTIRHIYQESVLRDAASRAYAESMAGYGEESRVVPEAPIRMTLIDQRFALLPIEPSSGRGALEIRGNGMVAALCLLFDMMWESGRPLDTCPAGDGDELSSQATAVLRLLRRGRTDEAIGRQLGLSERTVRRTVSELMKRLDAESRFQAGAEAALRGWV